MDNTYEVEYRHNNQITTKITVNEKKSVITIENYSDNPMETAFGVNLHPTMKDYEAFLESRCFSRNADGMKLRLQVLGLSYYDPLSIVKKTNGRMEGDFFSLHFIE